MATYRGSRKHILDWTSTTGFPDELLALVRPVPARRAARSRWMPGGYDHPEEARLETFGPQVLPGLSIWPELGHWWLARGGSGNTPNWDIALSCEINYRPGLILVEAKANTRELSPWGKRLGEDATPGSLENHARIGEAIEEAGSALRTVVPGVRISRDSHYQLSNRLAFGWKLASLGIPTIIVYLGFIGDSGIADAGEPFRDEAHWQRVFADYASPVAPTRLFERAINGGRAPVWYLVRTRTVLESSQPGSSLKHSRRSGVGG